MEKKMSQKPQKIKNPAERVSSVLDVILSFIFFISLLVIVIRYGIVTFFNFPNYGAWEKIINIGVFWIIGSYCIDTFSKGIENLTKKNEK